MEAILITFRWTGGLLVVALMLWLLTYPRAWPIVALMVACAGAFVGGRAGSTQGFVWQVPAAIVIALTVLLVADPVGSYSNSAGGGPLGYSNARAALFAQGAIAAGMLFLTNRSKPVRLLAVATGVAFALVPLASGSMAAAGALIAVGSLALVPMRWARPAIAICGAMLVILLTGTLMWAGGISPPETVERALGERRLVLWEEANQMMLGAPIRGVGADGFVENSPTASGDADARWVHHEFLELVAEHGLVAGVLAVGVVAWLFAEFGRRLPIGGRPVLLGAAAVTLLGLQACVDYIAHFPAIPLIAALLAGVAAGAHTSRFTEVSGSLRSIRVLESLHRPSEA